ncbi:putative sexual development protein (LsdA) [Aspergillus clavatus NRRL 1]|uniref:Sexual development protein (LsdA), putative n=1 Tax=Aspergillus clavatus (strain ATCC 1007 / CBS 513.65 / DSM 816 / NCTC 3887 / NRRL 1 / QM 1276 / 107) TaxID=344612 RepID=A1CAY1_ASPCL|nr:sexual development protein (LsdA), putative [Aspergillus clavatus NRRL 1]EAW12899.1 sexual development protein (LsdA), putative [Aspergillus clavatus NRRL 1]
MQLLKTLPIALLFARPFIHAAPLPDGMPNPTPGQIRDIELRAHGTLPNTPLPNNISQEGIVNLQLIAFNELFEVAFFNDLLLNVTNNVPGFQIPQGARRDMVNRSLTAILAQEELHALSANDALQHFNVSPILPCQYHFPVSDFDQAIALAATFTDLVLGTLQDVVERFAVGGDFNFTRIISSVIGNEGEQEGWFRTLQSKIPSELPFPTTSNVNFAFTAVQAFVVPGSCPNINEIPLRTFPPLAILTPPAPTTQIIRVAWNRTRTDVPVQNVWLTYINQLNLPIVEPMNIISAESQTIVAEVLFPYDEHLMNGLTIAAVTNSSGHFPNADAVSQATVAGPGLIVVN